MNDVLSTVSVNKSRLFQRLRVSLFQNGSRVLIEQSAMRIVIILLCSVFIGGAVLGASLAAFQFFVRQDFPLVEGVVGILFDILFLALAVMLIFSTGLILYTSLFSSAEARFLLATPARADQIFVFKFQGAIAFSSWAFLLLGCPILLAYGIATQAPWYFFVCVPVYFMGFVLLPGSVGALVMLLIVNFVPRHRKQVFTLLIAVLIAGLVIWGYQFVHATRAYRATRDIVQAMVGQLAFAQGVAVPSHWMAKGLQAAAAGRVTDAAYYMAILWSNGLLIYVLAVWAARHLYRRGYNRVATGGTLRRRYGGHWLDHYTSRLLPFLDTQTRLLIVKDLRTFRRDPSQWAQILIFATLMTLYFTNIRRLYLSDIGWSNRNGISLLNLGATALLLCTYTSRFIYPMLSLEGRKFWILGLLPLQRERLLWGKFAFSATGSVLIAEFLIVLSDVMLDVPFIGVVLHVVTIAVLALGLSSLSVGLGACLPNFREIDPSKIAVGFGGTLNLVAGLLFLLTVLSLMAAPWHVFAAPYESDGLPLGFTGWLVLTLLAIGLGVGVVAVVVPLRLGAIALRQMEF